ncbi:unnamed protein product [Bathycoccus prasinos]
MMMRSSIVWCSSFPSSSFSPSSRSRHEEERRSSATGAFRRPRRGRLVRRNMGKKIIAEDSEDEEDMSIRSSTITMDMLEKAEDQFWEESIDTGEGSYDDFDIDGSDLEDDDDGLGEGTVLLRRKKKRNNKSSKTNEESRATRTLENSILRARQFASTENARKIVQEGEKARVVARSTLAQSSERAAEISKQAVEKAEFVRRQIEAVPNKKEIVSAAAAATAATAAISTVLAEPLMTMAGSIVAFSLVKSFETMDEQFRQKQKEIETKKREEKVDLLMKTKERKVETRVEVVDAPLEVVSAVTSSTPPVEERVKTTREEKTIVEKEEELLGASAAAATTTQQATTTPRSRTATNSATSGFVSQIANENETALFEARKKREQILNEMAQYNDAPATTKNGNTMRPGKLAETMNNKYFANCATKRTADVLGYSTTPPQNVPTDAQKEPKASTTSPSPSSSEKKKRDDNTTTSQKISLFDAFFAVCAFPFTLLLELFRACVEVLKKYFFSSSSGEERDAGERS